MKIFTTVEAGFGYFVGTAVVVVAKDRREAKKLIEAEGGEFTGKKTIEENLVELDVTQAHALVLQNGDY